MISKRSGAFLGRFVVSGFAHLASIVEAIVLVKRHVKRAR